MTRAKYKEDCTKVINEEIQNLTQISGEIVNEIKKKNPELSKKFEEFAIKNLLLHQLTFEYLMNLTK